MNLDVVTEALTQIFVNIVNFIPNLVNGVIVLIVGYLVARLVGWLAGFLLRHLQFDPLVERRGLTGVMRGLGVTTPLSGVVARTIFWLLLIAFLITATRLMGLEAVAALLERLLAFLPNIIAAFIVFLLGGIVAKFVNDALSVMAAGAGLAYAARLGRLAQHIISIFVAVLALSILGIDTSLLITAITLLIAAFGLAMGLALGLGGRGIVNHILAGYYIRQSLPAGRTLSVAAIKGEVRSVGSVNTIVASPEGDFIVPNSVLLESILQSPHRNEDTTNLDV